jgi:hypothetical protein
MLFFSADNATGTSDPNNSKQAIKPTDITPKIAAKTATLPRSPRAIPDASPATSPTVTTGNEANVIATVPNSHSGDRNDVGNQRNRISTLAITARISPTLPNAFHAVLGAVETIGLNAFRSA